ncbi:MAG: hypothetical protein IJY91_07425 [Oscillospiraceae bacterium]|nr:hypothetical protein [Oscillospiraceae bacterium]
MNQSIEQKNNEMTFGQKQEEINSIIEFLASRYLEENPVTSDEIAAIQKEMDPYYENIPFSASGRLFQLVYDLCGHYESAAFRDGLRIGLRLKNEIEAKMNA